MLFTFLLLSCLRHVACVQQQSVTTDGFLGQKKINGVLEIQLDMELQGLKNDVKMIKYILFLFLFPQTPANANGNTERLPLLYLTFASLLSCFDPNHPTLAAYQATLSDLLPRCGFFVDGCSFLHFIELNSRQVRRIPQISYRAGASHRETIKP